MSGLKLAGDWGLSPPNPCPPDPDLGSALPFTSHVTSDMWPHSPRLGFLNCKVVIIVVPTLQCICED